MPAGTDCQIAWDARIPGQVHDLLSIGPRCTPAFTLCVCASGLPRASLSASAYTVRAVGFPPSASRASSVTLPGGVISSSAAHRLRLSPRVIRHRVIGLARAVCFRPAASLPFRPRGFWSVPLARVRVFASVATCMSRYSAAAGCHRPPHRLAAAYRVSPSYAVCDRPSSMLPPDLPCSPPCCGPSYPVAGVYRLHLTTVLLFSSCHPRFQAITSRIITNPFLCIPFPPTPHPPPLCSLKADMARPRLTLSGGDHRHQEGESRLLNFPMRESSLNNSAGLVKRSTGFLASSPLSSSSGGRLLPRWLIPFVTRLGLRRACGCAYIRAFTVASLWSVRA